MLNTEEKISLLDVKGKFVWVRTDPHMTCSQFRHIDQQVKKSGGLGVIATNYNVKIEALDDERLKRIGLQRIEK